MKLKVGDLVEIRKEEIEESEYHGLGTIVEVRTNSSLVYYDIYWQNLKSCGAYYCERYELIKRG